MNKKETTMNNLAKNNIQTKVIKLKIIKNTGAVKQNRQVSIMVQTHT